MDANTNPDVLPGGWRRGIFSKLRSGAGVFLCVLVAVAIYATIFDSFWLRFVDPLIEGLRPIAVVQDIEGTGLRKTLLDKLWLDLRKQSPIYDSDLISTGEGDRVTILIGKDLSLGIEPNSLVRIKSTDGKPLVRLSRGSLSVKAESEQTLLIQRGSKVEDLVVKKGSYVIQSDSSFGVQITSFEVKAEKEPVVAEAEPEKEGLPPPDQITRSDDEPDSTDGRPSSAKPTAKRKPLPEKFDLPTPKDNAQILVQEPRSIVVSAESLCPDKCQLKVFRDQVEWRTLLFSKGQRAYLRIEPEELKEGRYTWIYSNESRELRSQFAVEKFTAPKLIEAIESGRHVEIH